MCLSVLKVAIVRRNGHRWASNLWVNQGRVCDDGDRVSNHGCGRHCRCTRLPSRSNCMQNWKRNIHSINGTQKEAGVCEVAAEVQRRGSRGGPKLLSRGGSQRSQPATNGSTKLAQRATRRVRHPRQYLRWGPIPQVSDRRCWLVATGWQYEMVQRVSDWSERLVTSRAAAHRHVWPRPRAS